MSRKDLQNDAVLKKAICAISILVLANSQNVGGTTSEVTSAELPEMRTNCGTLPSTIHVTKEEYNDQGKVVRSCEGTVAVNKCEGTCVSQVQPSVVTPTGFLKDCQCCRESWMRQKEVKLNECYDSDGQKLRDKDGMMYIQVQEPEECTCHKCGT